MAGMIASIIAALIVAAIGFIAAWRERQAR